MVNEKNRICFVPRAGSWKIRRKPKKKNVSWSESEVAAHSTRVYSQVKGMLQAENIKWQPEKEEDVLCIPSERARAFRRNMQEMFKIHEFYRMG